MTSPEPPAADKPKKKPWAEIIVGMFILLILAALIAPRVTTRTEHHRAKEASDIAEIRSALSRFRLAEDRYPTDTEGVQALIKNPGFKSWHGPYLEKLLNDRWGRPYIYANLGNDQVSVKSYGADGVPGGEGEDADVDPDAGYGNIPEQPDSRAVAAEDLTQIRHACSVFRLQCDRYPTTAEGLSVLVKGKGIKGWNGPYIKAIPKDPWGHPYIYKYFGKDSFGVASYGADGKPGGGGDDADVGDF